MIVQPAARAEQEVVVKLLNFDGGSCFLGRD